MNYVFVVDCEIYSYVREGDEEYFVNNIIERGGGVVEY